MDSFFKNSSTQTTHKWCAKKQHKSCSSYPDKHQRPTVGYLKFKQHKKVNRVKRNSSYGYMMTSCAKKRWKLNWNLEDFRVTSPTHLGLHGVFWWKDDTFSPERGTRHLNVSQMLAKKKQRLCRFKLLIKIQKILRYTKCGLAKCEILFQGQMF